jgi:hypothetical protein
MPVKKAYILTVDMGYGHQRAVYPLKDIAALPVGWKKKGSSNIISANNYPGIPKSDRNMWEGSRKLYETISRLKHLPIVGNWIFGAMDYFQRIEPFYPKRDLTKPIMQVRSIYKMINKGWGKALIEELNKKPLPIVTSFFATAFFAEEHGYEGDIYCLCTDTDISRAWAPMNPSQSRIKYFAPNKRVKERLGLYGIKTENIFVTGFPLPKENIGDDTKKLKESLGCRIANLDPNGKFQKKYERTLSHYLGARYCNMKAGHKLTITFAVGGAGAQRELGVQILTSLHKQIDAGNIVLNLVAGSRPEVKQYFENAVKDLHLDKHHGGCINVIFDKDKLTYFAKFNEALKTTDILWTKPSELSFYSGLGLPIIMSPTIGSQEVFNRTWLHSIGSGMEQENPDYTHEWLFDWLSSGWLAQAAMEGFLDAPHNGAYHIEEIVLEGKRSEIEDMHLM